MMENVGVFALPGTTASPRRCSSAARTSRSPRKTQEPGPGQEGRRADAERRLPGDPRRGNGLTPAKASLSTMLGDDEFAQATIAAASNAKLTPAAAGWASVEGARILEDLFVGIASGGDVAELAAAADEDHGGAAATERRTSQPRERGRDASRRRPRRRATAAVSRDRQEVPMSTDAWSRPHRARADEDARSHGLAAPRRALPYGLLLPALLALLRRRSATRWCARWCCRSRSSGWPSSSAGRPSGSGCENYRELLTDRYLWTVVLRSRRVLLRQRRASRWCIGVRARAAHAAVRRRCGSLVQAGLLLAWAMPVLAAMTVWQWLFDTAVRRRQLGARHASAPTTPATPG